MAATNEDTSICIGCGLCCDGTLHGYTGINPGEERAVAAVDLVIEEEGGKRIFRQPCPHFSCGKCRVYSDRPPVCSTYSCALLERVDAGSITPDEGRARIFIASKLRSAVVAAAPEATTPARRSALARQLKSELSSLTGEEHARAARLLLDLAALDHVLTRSFRKTSET